MSVPSRRIYYRKIKGQPFGAWWWRRNQTVGIVFRVGPIGHLQIQTYRMRLYGQHKDGRRGKHGVDVHCWGVRGRRRKRGAGFHIML